jgi:hypothetical protein
MTFLSCLGIGIAFLLAVGLLVFAGVLLGWALPAAIERSGRPVPESSEHPGQDRGSSDEGSRD